MRGQTSLETVGLLGGVLLLMLAIIIYIPEQTTSILVQRDKAVALESATTITKAADEVYLSGEGAMKSIWIELPESYDDDLSFIGTPSGTGTWKENKTVSIYVRGIGDIWAQSRAPLCGQLPNSSGRHRILVNYSGSGTAHVMINSANC